VDEKASQVSPTKIEITNAAIKMYIKKLLNCLKNGIFMLKKTRLKAAIIMYGKIIMLILFSKL